MAVTWITIAVADLNNYLVAAQVSAVNTAALGSGQTDRFTEVQLSVISRIRNKIESCRTNRISETALTIPPSLKACACLLIIEGLQSSIPSLKLSPDQVRQIEKYEDDLTAIAKCELTVEDPTDPLDPRNSTTSSSPSFGARTRNFERDDQDGI